MTEPQRITEPGLAKTLIDSMAGDGPSEAARHAAAAALGITLPPAAAAPTTSAAAVVAGRRLVGVKGALAIGGVVVAGVVGWLAVGLGDRRPLPAIQVEAPLEVSPAPAPPAAIAPSAPIIAPPAPLAERSPAPRPIAPERAPPAPAIAKTPPPPDVAPTAIAKPAPVDDVSTLGAETALLDSARAALRSTAAANALAMLDRYAEAFPRGELATEATALRVEALFQAGDRHAAFALARDFLDLHGDSALANRIRSLLATETARDQIPPVRH